MTNEEFNDAPNNIICCASLAFVCTPLPFACFFGPKSNEAWTLVVGSVSFVLAIFFTWLCIKMLVGYRTYKKQKSRDDVIKAFNKGKTSPRWFMLKPGTRVIRNAFNGRAIRLDVVGSQRMCSVDENGKFMFCEKPWYVRDVAQPGRVIVSKTTGKLTFIYLKKNYR